MKTTTPLGLASRVLAIAAMFAVLTLKAQITLTQSDMPQLGNDYIIVIDTIPTVTQGNAGANQTWNLSAIVDRITDTLFCVSPSSTHYSSNFPFSNLAVKYGVNSFIYDFYNSSSGSFAFQGFAIFGNSTLGILNSPETIVSLPANYKTNWNSTYREVQTESSGFGDSVRDIYKFSEYDTIDGWGNVTTPSGTFPALRKKEIYFTVYDSSYEYYSGKWNFLAVQHVRPEQESFFWFAKGKGYPVAELDLDSLGGPVNVAIYLKSSFLGIDEINPVSASQVYPNPASTSVNIVLNSTSEDGYVTIIDIAGREMENTSFRNGRVELNTSGYATGMYFYKLTDKNGNGLDKGKFSVVR